MKIALVGNQNSGKTTLFNHLTGSNQKVGNWPGVTIERKEGQIKGTDLMVVDLPGIYSLSPYTSEEEISIKYIIEECPDMIINVVDATCIERSLYLTTQLLELDTNVIIALNMCDIIKKKGIFIDNKQLELLMGARVVMISSLKNTGIKELIKVIKTKQIITNPHNKIFSNEIERIITKINPCKKHKRFISIKILENDLLYANLKSDVIEIEVSHIEKRYGCKIDEIIANLRYNYIMKIKSECFNQNPQKKSMTDKLDKLFLNKWLAIPIFIFIMMLVYLLAVGVVGSKTVFMVNKLFANLNETTSSYLNSIGVSNWIVSLVCNGIITGVAAVLSFIPQLIILFLCISLLETTGYMSRITFLLDRLFLRLGLSGKSLIPFIIGSGCSVPAIMSTRIIENDYEKRITIICTPFIPCSAKLPIIVLFSGYFFNEYSGLIIVSLYFLAILVIIISALILKCFIKSTSTSYISELPEYRFPSIKYIFFDVWDKTLIFIKRAGTTILLFSIITWFLLNLSFTGFAMNIKDSILASIGNIFAWIFYPIIGEWSWAATVAAIQGLVAKEQVVSSMTIIAGLTESTNTSKQLFASGNLFGFFNPASAYAYIVFCLFSAPCVSAIASMKKELGTKKRMWGAIVFQTVIAWIFSVFIFIIGSTIIMIVG